MPQAIAKDELAFIVGDVYLSLQLVVVFKVYSYLKLTACGLPITL